MAAVTICSDFGAPKIKSATISNVSPSTCLKVYADEHDQNEKEVFQGKWLIQVSILLFSLQIVWFPI